MYCWNESQAIKILVKQDRFQIELKDISTQS